MFQNKIRKDAWRKSQPDLFWGEIAPCDHVLQVYDEEQNLLDVLTDFVKSGLKSADGVILIATDAHLDILHSRLKKEGLDIQQYINRQYFPLDAQATLSKFMIHDWPDEMLFMELMSGIMKKVRMQNRKIRAFGEMVAILWENGFPEATIKLESLWNKFCEKEMLCLFCAYPKSGFKDPGNITVDHLCSAHSKILYPSKQHASELMYARLDQKNSIIY